jgi:hypothetical protein
MSIFTDFSTDPDDRDIVPASSTVVTTGLWSGDTGSLNTSIFLNTGTDQQLEVSSEYYIDVYNTNPTSDQLAEVQFAITYGHIDGGGAPSLTNNEQGSLPTKAIYSQYKNILLDATDTKFSFQGVESDHIYVINFQRARAKEKLDPGNWELPLSGTRGIITFIDDSNDTLETLTLSSKAGRVYNIVSGALSTISGSVTASTFSTTFGGQGYGLAYPDLGILVLNPNAIGPAVGFLVSSSTTITGSAATGSVTVPLYASATDLTTATVAFAPVTQSLSNAAYTGKKSAFNHGAIFVSLKNAIASGQNRFKARSAETISSTHYFVRLRNTKYNYSNNPTFYNENTGVIVNANEFKFNPKVYITTIGLYNTNNELLAVAKLSKPVRKSFDEELLLRVRLDF